MNLHVIFFKTLFHISNDARGEGKKPNVIMGEGKWNKTIMSSKKEKIVIKEGGGKKEGKRKLIFFFWRWCDLFYIERKTWGRKGRGRKREKLDVWFGLSCKEKP